MSKISSVEVDLALMLGHTYMPVHQLLRMGRGAVIELDGNENGPFTLYANNHPIADAEVLVDGDRIRAQVMDMRTRDTENTRD